MRRPRETRKRQRRPRPSRDSRIFRFETLESRRVLATFFVDSVVDQNPGPGDVCAAGNPAANNNCTLRLAIQQAETNPGPDTIEIAPGNYVINPALFGYQLANAQDTAFVGDVNDPAAVVIDGAGQQRVFDIFGAALPGNTYNVVFEALTIQNGVATDGSGGGGINAGQDVNLFVNNVIVQNNFAELDAANAPSSGGGIQASGNVTIDNSIIQANAATGDGGGIDFAPFGGLAKTLNIQNNSIIRDNNSGVAQLAGTGQGGGILLQNAEAQVFISGSVIDNNEAADSGGGIFSRGSGFVMADSQVTGNDARGPDGGGGGVYVQQGLDFTINNTAFVGNTAVGGAGGLEALETSGTITGGEFRDNQVNPLPATQPQPPFEQGGGAIAILGGFGAQPTEVEMSLLLIENNSAPSAGGVAIVDANVTMSDMTIRGNMATSATVGESGAGGIGAVASVDGRLLTIDRSLIVDNSTAAEGGGIGAVDVDILITDSVIDNNTAIGARAGGIGLIGNTNNPNTQTPLVDIASSTISNNVANTDAGGIGVQEANVQLTNVTVASNRSENGLGGGLAYNNSGIVDSFISFSTFADNAIGAMAAVGGSNLNGGGTSALTVSNSIFARGTCAIDPGSVVSGDFNIEDGATCGFTMPNDRQNTDPLLQPLQAQTLPLVGHLRMGQQLHSYGLMAGSPAIDAASNQFPATDTHGTVRPLDGNGDTVAAADIGAFEAAAVAPLEVDLQIIKTESADPVAPGEMLTYTIVVTNNGPDEATGVTVNDTLPPSLAFVSGDVDGNPAAVMEAGGDIVADIGNLAAAASATLTITTMVGDDAVATIENTAVVVGNETDPDPDNNESTESTAMSLALADDVLNIDEDEMDAAAMIADVLANDLPLGMRTIVSVTPADLGEVSIINNGSAISFDPAANVFGQEVLTYQVDYDTGQSATADLTVNIAPVNDEPTTNNDNFQLPNSRTLVIDIADLLGNDSSGPANEGQVLIFDGANANSTNGGSIVPTLTTLTYEPAPGFNGPVDSFDYTVSDGAAQATGTVNINFPAIALVNVDLTTTITDDVDPVMPGDDVTFTVEITNQGAEFATGVESTTILPDDFAVVSAVGDALGVATIAGNTITSEIAALDPGVTSTVTIVATAINPGGLVTDTNVTSTEDEVTPGDNQANELTSVQQQPPTVQGHVFCDANGNGNEDVDEAVEGTTVFLDEDSDRKLGPGESSTQTDAAGDYQFFGAIDPASTVVVLIPPNCNTIPDNPGVFRSDITVGNIARSVDTVDLDGDGNREIVVVSEGSEMLTVLNNVNGELTLGPEMMLGNRPRHVFAYEHDDLDAPMISVAGIGTSDDLGSVVTMDGTANVEHFKAGNGPIESVIANFDRVAEPDLLVVSFRSSELLLSLNRSSEFETLLSARLIRSVDAGDVDGDGNTDIVVASHGFPGDETSELITMLGDGEGGFAAPVRTELGAGLVSAKVVDLSDDPNTNQVAVMALSASGELSVLTVNGVVEKVNSLDVGRGAIAFDVGDFNRDGLTDVAVANLGDQQIDLLVGDGTGEFAPVTSINNVSAPSSLVVDDVDQDMVDDIIVTNLYHDLNLGQGPPQYQLPSRVTLLRLNIAEGALMASGELLTAPDFPLKSADPARRLDVNRNGSVTTSDALAVMNRLQESAGEPEQVLADDPTDVNGDGITSALDALLIINHVAQLQDQNLSAAIDLIAAGNDDDEDDQQPVALDVVLTHSLV